jgi:hypothetical protein
MINATAISKKIVLSNAISIVERRNPYVNFSVGFRCDKKTAIHEKMRAITSLRLWPASDSRAIEFERMPRMASTATNMIFIVMPVLKAAFRFTE